MNTTDHKLIVESAEKLSAMMADRVRFLVACAEAELIGSEKRNQFNMCAEELLFWGKLAESLLPPDKVKREFIQPAPPANVRRVSTLPNAR
jgi:hypothetical protein